MEKSKEVFIDGEIVYLKKDFLGWHVTHPIKIDGKINWKNLIASGSWLKLILVIVFVLIILFTIFEYIESLRYCTEFITNHTDILVNPDFNLTL